MQHKLFKYEAKPSRCAASDHLCFYPETGRVNSINKRTKGTSCRMVEKEKYKNANTVNLPYKVSGYKESRLVRSHSLRFATAFCYTSSSRYRECRLVRNHFSRNSHTLYGRFTVRPIMRLSILSTWPFDLRPNAQAFSRWLTCTISPSRFHNSDKSQRLVRTLERGITGSFSVRRDAAEGAKNTYQQHRAGCGREHMTFPAYSSTLHDL